MNSHRIWPRHALWEDDDPEECCALLYLPAITWRVSALVARSLQCVTDHLIAHPLSQQICENHLLPNGEYGYQLHVSAALEVGPGAREQILHREEDSFTFFLPSLSAQQPYRMRPMTISRRQRRHFASNRRSSQNGLQTQKPANWRYANADIFPRVRFCFCKADCSNGAGEKYRQRLALQRDPHLFAGLSTPGRKSIFERPQATPF